MKSLTNKQRKVLKFIKEYIKKNGYSPSIKEIMSYFSFSSPTSVISYLNALENKGYIKRERKISRGITVRDEFIDIPILGRIPAGLPKIEEENRVGYLNINKEFLGEGEYFSLIVKGDSMKEAGIFDGDYAIVKKDTEIRNGDIVVAFINGEYTVKYFFKGEGFIELRPANSLYQSIILKEDPLIIGKVVGIFRRIK